MSASFRHSAFCVLLRVWLQFHLRRVILSITSPPGTKEAPRVPAERTFSSLQTQWCLFQNDCLVRQGPETLGLGWKLVWELGNRKPSSPGAAAGAGGSTESGSPASGMASSSSEAWASQPTEPLHCSHQPGSCPPDLPPRQPAAVHLLPDFRGLALSLPS